MILVIGGAFQGKKAYVKKQFKIAKEQMLNGGECRSEAIYSCKCIDHFHEWVRQRLKENYDFSTLTEDLRKRNPDLIVITNELGCGIVPADAFDREFREMTGRLCTQIAANSRQVHRVVCGIGTVIKDCKGDLYETAHPWR